MNTGGLNTEELSATAGINATAHGVVQEFLRFDSGQNRRRERLVDFPRIELIEAELSA